ncbi:MAG: hemagglutinin repeat-containing protein [Elusimicrobiota bacterium]|jgi:filamentous hemagglutinin|nr:hemagglutinin repeat-containing protein [Elusimicrobiota bacterium]
MLKAFNKVLSIVLAAILALPVQGFAQTITLPDGTTVISFDKSSANDTPVINIAAPNNNGLSHNRFNSYNVGPENLILNNSKEEKLNSLIGGEILGNPNLIRAGREAQIILNEVTSVNPSIINGYTEIAGNPAELIIANPNGISVAGAGFINTPSVNLITGNSKIQNGSLLGFDISQTGKLEITGALSAENADLGLIGRYISTSGAIHANNIDIFAGNKYFDYNTRAITSESGQNSQEFAVDVSALGGMYANRIKIIGTEEGFGVRTVGKLVADLNDIEINNNGKIEAKNLQAKQSVNLTSAEETEITNAIGENINIEAGMDIKAEELHSQKNINLKSQENITLTKTYAEQDINLQAQKDVKNSEVYAKNNISVQAGNIAENTIKAGSNIYLTATEEINNTKSIEAGNNINIKAKNTTNDGKISAQQDINLESNTITNKEDKDITAKRNIEIKAEEVINDGLILSNNNIRIESDTTNNNQEIAAYKDIILKQTQSLNNSGLLLANNKLNIEGGIINNKARASIYGKEEVKIITDKAINNYLANIYSDGDINISGLMQERSGDLTNTAGLIQAGKDITIKASNINNLSIDNCDPTKEVCYTKEWVEHEATAIWVREERKFHNPLTNKTSTYYVSILAAPSGRMPATWEVVLGGEEIATPTLGALYTGKIYAGKKININTGDINNHSSIINAGEKLSVNADNIYNGRTPFSIPLKQSFWRISEYGYSCGLFGLDTCHRKQIDEWDGEYEAILHSLTPAIISAPVVSINANNAVYNDVYTEGSVDLPLAPATNHTNLNDIVDPLANANFDFNGLFKPASPDSSYLYTSTNRFIDPNDYTGVNYLLVKLNETISAMPEIPEPEPEYVFNPITDIPSVTFEKQSIKFIGDAYYEQKLIEEAILQLTGSRYLYEGTNAPLSMNEQMARLYDNALEAFGDLNLNFGKALTAEQITQLKDNIIWYVEQEIDGQKVYVPTLYIAEHNKEQFLSNLNNSTIKGDNVTITAEDILNSGNIEAGVAHLYAKGDIKNLSGVIYAQDSLDLTAEGNIINETKKNTIQHSGNNFNYQQEYLSDIASIGSGGNLNMTAGQDINIKAAEVIAGNNLNMNAENVNITTAELNQDIRSYGSNYKYENSSTTNVGSLISAGNNIDINAANDITIKASDVYAQNDINLSGENVNILSAVDSSHYYRYYKTKSGFMGSKTNIEEDRLDKSWHIGSNIGAGGNLNINANNDITVLASNLSTGNGNMFLDAAENINILAGVNEDKSLHRRESSSWWGLTGHGDTVYDEIRTLEAASAFSGNNITFKNANDITILASDIGAKGEGNFETGGDFNLLAGIESIYSEETHWEQGFGGFVASFGGGRASVGIAVERDENTTTEYTETVRASTLDFGGNLNINSQGNVNIVGSDAIANEIEVLAKNITIMSAEELSTFSMEEIHKRIEMTVGVSNAYVNAGLAVYGIIEAEKALEDAIQELKKAKENPRIKDYSDYEKNVELATAGVATAILAAAAAAAGAVGSTATLGMSGDVQVKTDITKDTYENQSATQRGSALVARGGDVNLKAQEDINQKGSYVVSQQGNISYDAGGNITIEAAANTYKEKSTHEQYTDTVTVGNSNTSASHSQNKDSSTYGSTTWANSGVYAENGSVTIKSGGDTAVKGGNILGQDVNLDIGGQLLVESMQDEIHANSKGSGFSIGGGYGGGVSANLGLNNSSGYTDAAWVSNQTSIVGTNSINVNADSTHIKGAVIANITEDGTDGGNLTLNTNSLTYENIEDYYESENKSSGFNINVNIGNNEDGTLNTQKFPKGSVGFNLANSGEEREQDTNATIGQGNIMIGGQEATEEQLSGLNRDITQSQVITRDELTGGLNGGLTIDLRLLDPTGEGQKEMWSELTNLPQNLVTTAMYGTQAAVTMGVIAADAILTAVDSIDGKITITTKDANGKEVQVEVDSERGLIGQVKDKAGVALAETEFAKHNAKADEILKNPGKYTAKEIADAEATRDAYYKQYGVSSETYKAEIYAKQEGETYADKDGEYKYRQGGYVAEDNKGGMNLIGADGNIIDGRTMKETSVHEGFHGLEANEAYADAMGNYAADRNGLFTIFGARYGSSGTSGNEWLHQGTTSYDGGILNLNSQPVFESNSEYLAGNNAYFTLHGAETTENKSFIASRDLKGILFIGTHDFIKISYKTKREVDELLDTLPGAREVFGDPQDLGGGEWGIIFGGFKEDVNPALIKLRPNDSADLEATIEYNNNSTKWYKPDWDYEQTEVNFNNNLSERENDMNIMRAGMNYNNNTQNGNYPQYGLIPFSAQQKADIINKSLNIIKPSSIFDIKSPTVNASNYVDTYNCIDWAATACRIAGGTNCNPNHIGVRPSSDNTNLEKYFR